jgi:sec-independent protein translocase protein TatA
MNTFAIIPGMSGVPEILLIAFVILLLFGSKKLPELARSLGKSLNEFKKGQKESADKPAEEKPMEENSAESAEEEKPE